jgi:hypothetical protein
VKYPHTKLRKAISMCSKYCPSLTLDDLSRAEAGIRAQALLRDGIAGSRFSLR